MKQTPLFPIYQDARVIPYAGYHLPVSFAGIPDEQAQVRERAGLFDVSHMGQLRVVGAENIERLAGVLPVHPTSIEVGHQRYSVILNDKGGIVDDAMVMHLAEGTVGLVVNGARVEAVLAFFAQHNIAVEHLQPRALMALQGPKAESVLRAFGQNWSEASPKFMQIFTLTIANAEVLATRSGYTGEDGFEISCAGPEAVRVANTLLGHADVEMAGLAVRDLLRLEAGLSLYGQDLDETTTPVEAGIGFVLDRAHLEARAFLGADILARQKQSPKTELARKKVAFRIEGRMAARTGCEIYAGGEKVGEVTSGAYSYRLNACIGMGLVAYGHHVQGTELEIVVRNKRVPASVVGLPFVPTNYYR